MDSFVLRRFLLLSIFLMVTFVVQAQTPPGWFVRTSDNNHIISIPLSTAPNLGGTPIAAGDYIGAFYDSTTTIQACAGMVVWPSGGSGNIPLTVWGNDGLTAAKDGYTSGDTLKFKIWQKATGKIFEAKFTFSLGPSLYAPNGTSVVSAITIVGSGVTTGPGWVIHPSDNNHLIAVPVSGSYLLEGKAIAVGDYVGVFYDSSGTLACAGYQQWSGTSVAITAWGDDAAVPGKSGMANAEAFQWLVWRASDGVVFRVKPNYDFLGFINDSLYVVNGTSGITGFVSTGRYSGGTVIEYIILNYIASFQSTLQSRSYRMIGLPGTGAVTLSSRLIRGRPNLEWVAFYDGGDEVYVPYTEENKDQFVFAPGKAFWVLSKFPFIVDSVKVSKVNLSTNNTYSIPLRPGWNMISNPFDAALNWISIQNTNNISDKIYNFVNGVYESKSNIFEIFKGYYLYNRKGLTELILPYQPLSNEVVTQQKFNQNESLELSIIVDNELRSAANIINDSNSLSDLDDRDQFAPPGNFEEYKIALINPSDQGYKFLESEARPFSKEGEVYELEIKAIPGKPFNVEFSGVSTFGVQSMILIDLTTKIVYDIMLDSSITLVQYEQNNHYRLLMGESSFAEREKDAVLGEFTLYQNYPNPFNPTTTIQFFIAEEGSATLRIVNTLGEEVYSNQMNHLERGVHTLQWNASGAASGVYIATVSGVLLNNAVFSQSKKLLLTK